MNLQINDLNPQELHGNWEAGYALDIHTVSSRPLPDGRFDTEYTELGDMVNKAKYQQDYDKVQPLAEIAVKFVKEQFIIDDRPLHNKLNAVIPIPPSDTTRPFQLVTKIAEKIGSILNRPVRTDYLLKQKQTKLLKSIPDVESKQAEIEGAFVVPFQDLKRRSLDLEKRRVLLFDDLYDSGVTLTEATDVLYKQGRVGYVFVLTLTETRTKK